MTAQEEADKIARIQGTYDIGQQAWLSNIITKEHIAELENLYKQATATAEGYATQQNISDATVRLVIAQAAAYKKILDLLKKAPIAKKQTT